MEIQLLFVDFRGSSHANLEWFCFLRDDIAPGGVRRILSRVDLHVISCFASFLFPLLSFFLFTCSLLSFLWALRTCQVGHFDSHIFWFLIEFFIENLVLTGGRYKTRHQCLSSAPRLKLKKRKIVEIRGKAFIVRSIKNLTESKKCSKADPVGHKKKLGKEYRYTQREHFGRKEKISGKIFRLIAK